MLHKMLEQFVTDVFWDRPDLLIVDMPPGTGGMSLSLAAAQRRRGGDRDDAPAGRPARRPASGAHGPPGQLRVGVVENMSWFVAGDGVRYELFGAGGGEQLAALLEVPLLGQLPLIPAVRDGADRGEPVVVSDPDGVAA